MFKRLNKWLKVALIGFIEILFQLRFPDLVPKYLINLISLTPFVLFDIVLEAILLIYIINGWVALAIGIFALIRSMSPYPDNL